MSRKIEMSGKKYGKLTVLRRSDNHPKHWVCLCDCGKQVTRHGQPIRSGYTKSCGCDHRKSGAANRTHGYSGTPTGRSWCMMTQRCFNPRFSMYPKYGAAGITACEFLKKSPVNLVSIIGERPSLIYSLDRFPDNSGNYSCGECSECLQKGWPKNIRWATVTEQARNRKSNVIIEINGVSKKAIQWADEIGIPSGIIIRRVGRGNPPSTLLRPYGERLLRTRP